MQKKQIPVEIEDPAQETLQVQDQAVSNNSGGGDTPAGEVTQQSLAGTQGTHGNQAALQQMNSQSQSSEASPELVLPIQAESTDYIAGVYARRGDIKFTREQIMAKVGSLPDASAAAKIADEIEIKTAEYKALVDHNNSKKVPKVDGETPQAEGPSEDQLANIRDLWGQMEAAMAWARGDCEPFRAELDVLEKAIGEKAYVHSDTEKVVEDMSQSALGMIRQQSGFPMDATDGVTQIREAAGDSKEKAAAEGVILKLGSSLESGWSGVVGKELDALLGVFENGNVRERCTLLGNFQQWFAATVYQADTGALQDFLKAGGIDEQQDLIQDQAKLSEGSATKGREHKALLGGDWIDGDVGDHAGAAAGKKSYLDAKSEHHDQKSPNVPLEMLSESELMAKAGALGLLGEGRKDAPTENIREELTRKITETQQASADDAASAAQDSSKTSAAAKAAAKQKAVGNSGGGESNPMHRSRKLRDRDRPDELSAGEKQAQGVEPDFDPFLEGWKANILKEGEFIKEARDELEMPLRSGISGTTWRFMNYASLVGADLPASRLAMFGYLILMDAHSFHEIATAASAFVPYTPGKYTGLAPLNDAEVAQWAQGLGIPKDHRPMFADISHGS